MGMFGNDPSNADRERAELEHAEATRRLKAHNAAELAEWKLGRLELAGYSLEQAAELMAWKVDTTTAVALLEKGCTTALAVQILEPDVLPQPDED